MTKAYHINYPVINIIELLSDSLPIQLYVQSKLTKVYLYVPLGPSVFMQRCTSMYCLEIDPNFGMWWGKGLFHNIWTKPWWQPRFTWYNRVFYIITEQKYWPVKHLYCTRSVAEVAICCIGLVPNLPKYKLSTTILLLFLVVPIFTVRF